MGAIIDGVVIAFASQKGGVGKSTCCINVAGVLAHLTDLKVLICDGDPQSHQAMYGHLKKKPAFEFIFTKQDTGDEFSVQYLNEKIQLLAGNPNVSVLTCHKKSIDVVNDIISKAKKKKEAGKFLRERMMAHEKFFNQFDIVIFDLPPSSGPLTTNVYSMVDYIVVPTEAKAGALDGVVEIINEVSEYSTVGRSKVLGIVQNMRLADGPGKPVAHRNMENNLMRLCKEKKIEILPSVRKDILVEESCSGDPSVNPVVALETNNSRAGKDFVLLSLAILKKFNLLNRLNLKTVEKFKSQMGKAKRRAKTG